MRTYLEDPGTKLLWWGRLLEVPGVVKLVVGKAHFYVSFERNIYINGRTDWTDEELHRNFQQSSHFKGLRESWGEVVKSNFYVFPDGDVSRQKGFTKSS